MTAMTAMTPAATGAPDVARNGEFRDGWQVVLAALLGIGLGLSPMPCYTLGVFAPHLAQAFGWSIGRIMGALTMTMLMVMWAGRSPAGSPRGSAHAPSRSRTPRRSGWRS